MRRLSLLRVVRGARLTPVVTAGVVATQVASVFAQTMPLLVSQQGTASPGITQAKAVAPVPGSASRIVPNRKVPSVTAPALELRFSATPSARDLTMARVLPEALRPTSESTLDQNRAVAAALQAFAAATDRGVAVDTLENFAEGVAGPWQASLLANVGTLRDQNGFYSRAARLWDEAWELSRFGDRADAHLVGDYAVSKRLAGASRFGQVPVLQARLQELEERPVRGGSVQAVRFARESLDFLVYHHEQAVFSGPEALKAFLGATSRTSPHALEVISAYHPSHEGTSLSALTGLAKTAGAKLDMRHVDHADEIPLPAIVHLKSNHFSALVAKEPDGFRLRDPALGGELFLSREALEDEMSGYVLVVSGGATAPGRAVAESEAASVVGHCFPGGPKDNEPCKCWPGMGPNPGEGSDAGPGTGPGSDAGPGSGPGPGSSAGPGLAPQAGSSKKPGDKNPSCGVGMPIYALHPMAASVLVTDAPLRYDPPRGPAIEFRLRYNQRSSDGGGATVAYGNVGAQWRHDWIAYVVDNNSSAVAPYVWTDLSERGEGSETYNSYIGNTYWRSHATLTQVSQDPPRYERALPDGSLEVYTFPDRAATAPARKVFLTQVIDPRGQAISFTYDASIRLVAVTDALGQVTTLEYEDPLFPLLLTKVTDPFGRVAAMTYNSVGQLVSVTDVIAMTSRFAYDEQDFMRSMTTPYGITQFRNEDVTGASAHRAVVATDPEGGSERLEYWATSAVGLSATAPSGDVPTGFDDLNQSLNLFNSLYWSKQAMQEAPGDRSRAVITRWLVKNESGYDPHAGGRAIAHSVKRPLESRVWYRYPDQPNANTVGTGTQPAAIGRVLDDGSTQLEQYTYNPNGWMTAATDATGRQNSYEYAANNIDLLAIRQTKPGGSDLVASLSGYTAQHVPAVVTDAAGQPTTLTYNAAGQVLTVTNPKSETTTYTYDGGGAGYLQSISGPVSGATVSLAYDALGRVQSVTGPDGYSVSTSYDALNRVTRTTYPDGTFDGVTYDKLDVAERTDRAGRVTRYFYNRNRQLTATRDPLGRVIRQDWCRCGLLEALLDGNGNRTSWTYDADGRVSTEVRADGATTTSTYDASSRLKTITDPKAQVATYTYAADGQPLSVVYSNATIATPTVSFTYDAVYPRATTMVDGIGTTTYTYKAPGQLGAGQVASVDGPLSSDVIAFTYDELGRVVTRTINGTANSVTWEFDTLGRVTGEQNTLGTFTYAYDGVTSRLASTTYPNGQTSIYSYLPNNQDRRLQTIHHKYPGGGTLSKFDYTYDAVGNILTWRQQADAAAVLWSYGYDTGGQLLQAVKASTDPTPTILQRLAYDYDAAENRMTEQIDDAVTGATHNDRNELVGQQPGGTLAFAGTVSEPAIVSIGSSAATVAGSGAFRGTATVSPGGNTIAVTATDASGNTATQAYAVSQSGASKTFTYDVNGNMTADGARTFEWDAKNRLLAVNNGTHRSEFTYDGLDRRVRIVEKESGTSVRDAAFVWVGAVIVEERLTTGEINRIFEEGEQHNSASRYLTRDHLRSIREVTDLSGTITTRNDYDPFGRPTRVSGSEDSYFAYTGHLAHNASGLDLALHRAYEPTLARWMSEDPIGVRGGLNLFGYVANSPINNIDPYGLDVFNRSSSPVLVKLEQDNAGFRWVMPGERFDGAIDGVKGADGNWMKTTRLLTDVVVNSDGTLSVSGLTNLSPFSDKPGWRDHFPGPKSNPGWEQRHSDWHYPPQNPSRDPGQPFCSGK